MEGFVGLGRIGDGDVGPSAPVATFFCDFRLPLPLAEPRLIVFLFLSVGFGISFLMSS